MAAGSTPDEEDEEEWRFSLSDLEDDEQEKEEESTGNVAGGLGPSGDVEPGDIDLENAIFVGLGVLAAGIVILGFVLAAI